MPAIIPKSFSLHGYCCTHLHYILSVVDSCWVASVARNRLPPERGPELVLVPPHPYIIVVAAAERRSMTRRQEEAAAAAAIGWRHYSPSFYLECFRLVTMHSIMYMRLQYDITLQCIVSCGSIIFNVL
jgi:hypothetical protein